MYSSPRPHDVRQPLIKRGRTPLACSACRKRKIKCHADLENYTDPCKRCARLKLTCEYIAVADDPNITSPSSLDALAEPSPIYLQKDNTTSHIYHHQSRIDLAITHASPAYRKGETFDTSNSSTSCGQGGVQSSQTVAYPPVQIFPQQNPYVHQPVPESMSYEAMNMQTSMALNRGSTSTQDQNNPNLWKVMQPMYQPPSMLMALLVNAPTVAAGLASASLLDDLEDHARKGRLLNEEIVRCNDPVSISLFGHLARLATGTGGDGLAEQHLFDTVYIQEYHVKALRFELGKGATNIAAVVNNLVSIMIVHLSADPYPGQSNNDNDDDDDDDDGMPGLELLMSWHVAEIETHHK
ncbi:hypothetical protein C8J56DRAFT_1083086 [Mycena floridula]|nr:hypothetical protein C8J56DRAFT_1083086 [Mycena floridula]